MHVRHLMPLRRSQKFASRQTYYSEYFFMGFFFAIALGGRSVSVSTGCAELNVRPTGWSAHELALFSRAAKLLSTGGLRIETDYGLTDEGEAWLVFCNTESGDVCGHFAKMHAGYVACIPFRGHGLRGRELRDVLARFLRRRGIVWSTVTRPVARHASRLATLGLAILHIA